MFTALLAPNGALYLILPGYDPKPNPIPPNPLIEPRCYICLSRVIWLKKKKITVL